MGPQRRASNRAATNASPLPLVCRCGWDSAGHAHDARRMSFATRRMWVMTREDDYIEWPPAVEDIRDEVIRLSGEGLSVRKIARQLGTSKSTVQRIITEEREAELIGDDDERAALGPIDAADYVAVPPFRYQGVDPGDGVTVDDWRYLDSADVSVTSKHVYDCVQALERAGQWAEAESVEADLERQYEAVAERDGLYREDLGGNFHVWRRRGEVDSSRS